MTFSIKMRFSFTFLTLNILQFARSQDKWPEYNQQCRDDAGPPFADDEDTFGKGGKYHDKSSAFPILQNGKCAPPIQKACETKPIKTAYLEGPIDCGDKGWYCRIIMDPNWKNYNLKSDFNFGHCNRTEALEDHGWDGDGHCHGSSHDNVYYWWVRDHWHRQYNGHLRCCCGWSKGSSSTPMYERRIANRCDYRRLVTKDEPLNKCRDANEGHGMGFDDIGCDKEKYGDQIGKPIPEDDGICWEVARFGYTARPGGTKMPSVTGGSPAPSTEGGGDGDDDDGGKN